MKHLILALFSLGISTTYAQDNCTDFHTGYFEYTVSGERYILYRTETHQIEYGLNNSDWIIMSMEWKSDCAYSMVFLNCADSDAGATFIGKTLDARIVNSDESGYAFVAEVREMSFVTNGEISLPTTELTSGQKKKIQRVLKKNS